MSTRLSLVLGLAAALATTACKKKADGAAGGGDNGGTAAIKIPQLKLQVDTTSDSTVSDMSMGGAPSYMVRGSETLFTVGEVDDSAPKTLDEAVEAAKIYDGVQVTKQDKTADGWNLQFHNKGSMGDNYFVDIRRQVGGRAVTCTTTASTPEQAAKAAAACMTVRPL